MSEDRLKITNITLTAELKCNLNLRHIALNTYNCELRNNKFHNLIIRSRIPSSTCLLYSTGKLIMTGIKSFINGKQAIRKIARIIQMLGYNVKLRSIKVRNIAGCFDFCKPINLAQVSQFIGKEASYEPEIFHGLIIRYNKVSLTVYHNGKMLITGATSEEILKVHFEAFNKKLNNFIISENCIKI